MCVCVSVCVRMCGHVYVYMCVCVLLVLMLDTRCVCLCLLLSVCVKMFGVLLVLMLDTRCVPRNYSSSAGSGDDLRTHKKIIVDKALSEKQAGFFSGEHPNNNFFCTPCCINLSIMVSCSGS